MRSVGIEKLKDELTEYVRLAENGETVRITEDNRVVAELVPPRRPERKETEEEFFARGEQEGWLREVTTPKGAPLPSRRPIMALEELMNDLDKDRADQ